MIDDIVHEAIYPYPPEDVWRALTTPAALRAWLMDTTFEAPVVGHRFQFRDKPKKALGWDGVTDCEVLEAEPPRRFVFRFGAAQEGFPTTRVEWDLEPVAEGTRVRFRHAGFTGFKGWLMWQGMNQGWGAIVRHALPFVVSRMRQGDVPSQDEARAAGKRGFRADHQAQRARG